MNITQFLDEHRACSDGRKRAAAFPSLEDAWQTCTPEDLIWVATRPGVLTDRELRRFSVFCARSVQYLMTDQRSIAAVDVAERHANGEATDDELHAAAYAARAAAYAAASAAYAAARAAGSAAYAHAASAHAASANYAASADVAASADAAASAAARKRQAAWLRQNTTPNFSPTPNTP